MTPKPRAIIRLLSFILSFLLCFEQSGFAQVAGQLDLAGHFAALRNALTTDKFRPLHLRYLSYDPALNNFRLLLDKGTLKNPSSKDIETTSKELLKYFLIGVSLPNESFWVNLRPDSPDNIIDEQVAKTDIGRIFLEADVQLKIDTAQATSPETPEGKEYWNKLYAKAEELFGTQNVTIPTLTRPWIVPDEIIIRETADNAYIYKATLKVMLEQDYLAKGKGIGTGIDYAFEDERLKQLNEYSTQLIKETIIPKLTKEVNASKRYAALRQVYYSLIMAQWFKQRFYGRGGLYSWLINKGSLNGLTSNQRWSKDTYFKQYQKSFKDGEYHFRTPVQTPFGQSIRSYFSGGIAMGQEMAAARAGGVVNPGAQRELSVDLANKLPGAVTRAGTVADLLPDVETVQVGVVPGPSQSAAPAPSVVEGPVANRSQISIPEEGIERAVIILRNGEVITGSVATEDYDSDVVRVYPDSHELSFRVYKKDITQARKLTEEDLNKREPLHQRALFGHATNADVLMKAMLRTNKQLRPSSDLPYVPLTGESAGTTGLNRDFVSTVMLSHGLGAIPYYLNLSTKAFVTLENVDEIIRKYRDLFEKEENAKLRDSKQRLIGALQRAKQQLLSLSAAEYKEYLELSQIGVCVVGDGVGIGYVQGIANEAVFKRLNIRAVGVQGKENVERIEALFARSGIRDVLVLELNELENLLVQHGAVVTKPDNKEDSELVQKIKTKEAQVHAFPAPAGVGIGVLPTARGLLGARGFVPSPLRMKDSEIQFQTHRIEQAMERVALMARLHEQELRSAFKEMVGAEPRTITYPNVVAHMSGRPAAALVDADSIFDIDGMRTMRMKAEVAILIPLAAILTDDELAYVLGHEFGHVQMEYYAQTGGVKREGIHFYARKEASGMVANFEKVSYINILFSQDAPFDYKLKVVLQMFPDIKDRLERSSRLEEMAADALGILMAGLCGLSMDAAQSALQKFLDNQEVLQSYVSATEQDWPYETHPPTTWRIEDAAFYAANFRLRHPSSVFTVSSLVDANQGLGAQVANIQNLQQLRRLLNVLRRRGAVHLGELPQDASDRQIMELCIRFLLDNGLAVQEQDEFGNVVIRVNDQAVFEAKDPAVKQFINAIFNYAMNPEGGVRAVNFKGTAVFGSRWVIIGFNAELNNPEHLAHEQEEVAIRNNNPQMSWQEAHEQANQNLNRGTRSSAAQTPLETTTVQRELGAASGRGFGGEGISDAIRMENEAADLFRDEERKTDSAAVSEIVKRFRSRGMYIWPVFSKQTSRVGMVEAYVVPGFIQDRVRDIMVGLFAEAGLRNAEYDSILDSIAFTAYELCYSMLKHDEGGIFIVHRVEEAGKLTGIELIAYNPTKEIMDLERERRVSFATPLGRKGLKTICSSSFASLGSIVYDTGGRRWQFNRDSRQFEVASAGDSAGTRAVLKLSFDRLRQITTYWSLAQRARDFVSRNEHALREKGLAWSCEGSVYALKSLLGVQATVHRAVNPSDSNSTHPLVGLKPGMHHYWIEIGSYIIDVMPLDHQAGSPVIINKESEPGRAAQYVGEQLTDDDIEILAGPWLDFAASLGLSDVAAKAKELQSGRLPETGRKERELQSYQATMGNAQTKDGLRKTPEPMLVRAYHRLFGFVLSALDPDRQATVLYPFMGPDMVPAHSRPTIGINLESRDAVIGREVVDAVLSESGDGLLNPNDSLDALEVSSYRFLQEANRSPCILLLKGFGFHSRGAAGSRVTSKESQISAQVQEVLGYIFANLRDGDTVLALDQNDVDMLSAYGISDASRALALYSFDPRYPLYVEAGFNDDHYQKKTLQMPNALLALKKENGKLTVIPFRGTPNEHNSWSNRDGRGAKGGIDGSASSPSTPGAGKAGGVDSSASSPSTPGAGKAGGVDFRALPIAIQPMPVAGLKPVPLSSIDNARLDAEWQQIERMLNGGIIPSVQRLKEYLVASCGAQDCPKRQEATLSCIADILRIEEDRSSSTDDSLKQLLVLLESGKPSAELQAGLMSIEVISNNPKVPK